MKTKNFFQQGLLFLAIGLTTAITNAQAILTVDNSPGSVAAYSNLQTAHDAATAGDIIYVQPSGTSYGDLTISKAITIVGASHSEPTNISLLGGISITASDIILKGLSISSISTIGGGTVPYENIEIFENKIGGISIGNGVDQTIDNIVIQGNQINYIEQYNNAANVLITNNIIAWITIYNPATIVVSNNIFRSVYSNVTNIYNYGLGTANLSNNMFIFSYPYGNTSVNFSGGPFQLSNNLFYNYYSSYPVSLAGNYSETESFFNTDPQFVNVDYATSGNFAAYDWNQNFGATPADLTLMPGSPALTGGVGGTEIGISSNFNYKYLGNPRGIPAMDIVSYNGTVPKNGTINVTVNAKAH